MPLPGWQLLQQARDLLCAAVRGDWHRKAREVGDKNTPICAESTAGDQLYVRAHPRCVNCSPTLSCCWSWYAQGLRAEAHE